MDVQIAAASPADLDAILPLMQAFHRHEKLAVPKEKSAPALAALLAESRLGFVLVARQGNATLGYAVVTAGYSLEFHGHDLLLDELFVAETRRGHGVGSRLLDAIESEARRRGVAALHLEVDHANVHGQELYRRRGYADHGRYLMTKWLKDTR